MSFQYLRQRRKERQVWELQGEPGSGYLNGMPVPCVGEGARGLAAHVPVGAEERLAAGVVWASLTDEKEGSERGFSGRWGEG